MPRPEWALTPLQEAMYYTVHGFAGGAVKLGPLVGISPGTLSNKVNPTLDTHKLSVEEAVVVQNATRDYRILYAMAMELNHSCIPLGDFNGVSDVELLNAYAAWHAEIGQAADAIRNALEDARVTRAEFERVRKEFHEGTQRGFEFLTRLEALVDD